MIKNLAFLALVSLLAFTSCSKNELNEFNDINQEKPGGEELQQVTINISAGITSEIVPMNTRATGATKIGTLRYIIHKSDSVYYSDGYIDVNGVNAVLQLKLPKGNYFLSLIASPEINWKWSVSLEKYQDSYFYPTENAEIFYKSMLLQVNGVEPTIINDIVLPRRSGKISLSISDITSIPANVQSVAITTRLPKELLFTGKKRVNPYRTHTYSLTRTEWLAYKDKAMDFYCFESGSTSNYYIRFEFKDANNKIIKSRTIEKLEIFENKITKISVALLLGSELGITLKDDWRGEVELEGHVEFW